jgi:hypothetical protein
MQNNNQNLDNYLQQLLTENIPADPNFKKELLE